MVVNIKNIVFKYVRIVSGTPSIDASMTDEKFYKTKPDGYYRCFIFPTSNFSGISYNDLRNLVLVEKDSMWDETNRDTFFGYCEQTNKFVCNINAYIGLKDTQLKTDGAMPYSGMACWYEMDITSTASNGIIKIKQTDGTDTYLSIIQPTGTVRVTGNACIEVEKKTISNADIVEKQGAFWVKSPQDNSVLMICYCLNSSMADSKYSFKKGNRLIYDTDSSRGLNTFHQTILYGKPVVHFPNSSAGQEQISIIAESNDNYIKNNTGKDYVEYTETDDLNSILNSNESLNFVFRFKNKTTYGYNQAMNSLSYGMQLMNTVNNAIPPLEGELFSLDPKNKPVLYKPSTTSFSINSTIPFYYKINSISDFIKNIPDGFIFTASLVNKSTYDYYIFRFKKGENVKYKLINYDDIIEISDASNKFGMEVYYKYTSSSYPQSSSFVKYSPVAITKSDLISGTGFTDAPTNVVFDISFISIFTVYKI